MTGTIATVSDALCTAKPSTAERTAREDKTNERVLSKVIARKQRYLKWLE